MTNHFAKFLITAALLFIGANRAVQAQPLIVINEFLTSTDKTGDSDWLELYNPQDSTVQIGGWHLSDKLSNPFKWQIPGNTAIAAKSHLLIWADNQDSGLHTNFALSKDGEQIGLSDSKGVWIDSLTFAAQPTDISYGRYPDGGEWGFYFDPPTPGAPNTGGFSKGILTMPQLSPASGFYSGTLQIELVGDPLASSVRYTLDGSLPTLQSPAYSGPIPITATAVVRAACFGHGYRSSPIATRTYLLDEPMHLPVVSVVTDPDNLWDDEIGIYVEGTNGIPGYCSSTPHNWNQDWERPANIEYLRVDGQSGFQLDCGMKIGGGCTRKYPQKTLAFYARSEYGPSLIQYPIFPDKNINQYNNILLRNSGQDWYRTLFRDGMIHNLVKDRMDIDWQAYQPAVVFLNGDYWGIHGIREKHNEHYVAYNHGLDPDRIDIVSDNGTVHEGSAIHYTELINYVKSHDLSQDEHYAAVCAKMDIDEYINYMITEIYCANIDWPGGNIKFWREQGDNHKWRWILFDVDLSFGAHSMGQYDSNTLDLVTSGVQTYYANPEWSTLLIRMLLRNQEFRTRFVQRFASHINTTFEPQRVLAIIDSLAAQLAPEIPRHKAKWPTSLSFGATWESQLEITREFARQRRDVMFGHLAAAFELPGVARLRIASNDPNGGKIFVEGVEIPKTSFSGRFFRDTPLLCKAVPAAGYRFTGWQGASTEESSSITLVLSTHAQLTANFEPVSGFGYEGLLINEFLALNTSVNQAPSGKWEDWIELYNAADFPIDVGGLWITDNLDEPGLWQIPTTAPDSTTIPPHEFLLLWADKEPQNGVLHVDIKLSGDGEQIGLFASAEEGFQAIDKLTFPAQQQNLSCGRFPDGSENMRYFISPTPGASNNGAATAVYDRDPVLPTQTRLLPGYPNPFNANTTLVVRLSSEATIDLAVFDVQGKRVAVIANGPLSAGEHRFDFGGSQLASGVYFVQLVTGQTVQRSKLLLLK